MFVAMLAGSCASSAGGGVKIVRWLLILKIMKSEMAKILHPKAVYNIKVGKYSVPKDVLYLYKALNPEMSAADIRADYAKRHK